MLLHLISRKKKVYFRLTTLFFIFIKKKELDNLFDKAVQTQGLTLVQIAAPPIGKY